MELRFIDYTTNGEIEVSIGTCELCFCTMSVDDSRVILQDVDTGVVYNIDTFVEDGDYIREIEIGNLVRFALWLEGNTVRDRDGYTSDFDWLEDIVNDYNNTLDG